jgi:tellurite resistance protein TerC
MTLRAPTSAGASPFCAARKIVVAVIGLSVLAFGVALIVLPGPAILVIPLGLAVPAPELLWARKVLHQLKARSQQMLGKPSRSAGPEAGL